MAVTLNYIEPTTAGATTPPTAAQMSKLNTVICQIAKSADGDTTATIVHNMALTAAQLAAGLPIVTLTPILAQGTVTLPFCPTVSNLTNSIVVTLGTATGSGTANPQIQVTIQRPFSKLL